MTRVPNVFHLCLVCCLIFLCAFGVLPARTQEATSPATKPSPKSAEAAEKAPDLPAQIELLETRVRFEANGDSRKEVHTRVHINNELGARQFARLAFDYNRSFQQIEFPLVRVTHSGGGTADILPSAISDQPNPSVVNAPAYQDVRVKSVRILGLAPSDILEYRVVTTTSHHPLAPDFWLDHTFDRSGVTANETFEVDLPASRAEDTQTLESRPPDALSEIWYHPSIARVRVSSQFPAPSSEVVGTEDSSRVIYRWRVSRSDLSHGIGSGQLELNGKDIVLSTFASWRNLDARIGKPFLPGGPGFNDLAKKLYALQAARPGSSASEVVYEFVSKQIRTVDLPLGSTGFRLRSPLETLSSGYGTPEDKVFLFAALMRPSYRPYYIVLVCASSVCRDNLPSPSVFDHFVVQIPAQKNSRYLDPSLEVAPFAVISPSLRGRPVLTLEELFSTPESSWWTHIPDVLPFGSTQQVSVNASLGRDGILNAKVKYTMRGDNELLLRLAFHQAPREKWDEVAQLLALSDGFRGKITSVSASDPYATKEPFTVEYEITQPKFVDWAQKPVRIPALLPQMGLPDSAGKTGSGASAIDLGTPLDVETHLTLHLPAGTTAHTPTGTSVARDYATFASKYEVTGDTITASRRLNFLLREIAADRAGDYSMFVNAVQGDEAQRFTLERSENAAAPNSASASGRKKK